ncbi:hypothetical protein AWW66_01095 [Micromonospora rosaria]|uniref:Isochorismatase n=1 Tax=Micromonospora rosaria TaxID=47874 RepID=A0A136PZJ6_9ACTN|nr:hypothetical protein [Micromonospora rosaria]KXK63807.1 hypothetical protein AWW66_01095 [Micromonospora rosaria]
MRYAPRRLVSLPADDVRGWTVKRYGISADRPRPPVRVIEAARVAVEASLPEAYDGAAPWAFSVVHEDADGCYLVVGWWSPNRVILHTRTWLSGWADPAAWTPAGAAATACVWEMVAIAHERDAWVRHVVASAEPDFAAYRADTVSGSF